MACNLFLPTKRYFYHSPECRECYSCGYQKTGQDGESTALPDLAFCSDFTTGSDITATCSLGDCCGSLKEYIIM